MLFPFSAPRPARFWMKNTLIPLDIIFIAPGGTVLNIETRRDTGATATSQSIAPAIAVLELNAGTAARLGIAPGDRVSHPQVVF